MLDFDFTPEQELARQALRELLARVAPREYVRRCDAEHRPPREAFQALAAHGWLGVGWPEEYGGSGGDPIDVAIVLEECGRVHLDLALWVFRSLSHGGMAIMRDGTEEQKRWFLPRIARGEISMSIGLTEAQAGSDAAAIQTTAVRDGDDYVITGEKWFTSGFAISDYCLLTARTRRGGAKHEGLTNFLVDTRSPGITARRLETLGTWALGTYVVRYDAVRVPARNVLGPVDQGWRGLMHYLETERLCLSAARTGAAAAAFEEALAYAKLREQFGQPIGKFQAISHKLADMALMVDISRLLVYRFAWLLKHDRPRVKEAAMLKLYTAEAYKTIADWGVQILGGYGYTMESDMQRHYRDSKFGTIGGGTSEIQRNIIAKQLGL
jgi:alkylation response protein AidB-like acyl-CoA dehydrogenase